jgi:hypothetical protein
MESNLPIIKLKSPFNLYHLTYRNTKRNIEYLKDEELDCYDILCELDENDFIKDLKHGKYFSISYYHPLYYCSKNFRDHYTFLCYQTIQPLILFDGRNYNKQEILDILNNLNKTQVDGWLIKDDCNDSWHEIYLFSPEKLVSTNFTEISYTSKQIDDFYELTDNDPEYPYEKEEIDIIINNIIK